MTNHPFSGKTIAQIRKLLNEQQADMSKGCALCLQKKKLSEFGIDWRKPDFRNIGCLKCRNYNQAIYRNSPDRKAAAVACTQRWRLKRQLALIALLKGKTDGCK